ncbi:hypothetical protein GO491_01425 [Flavobacteriaceae bacterium Ap0902]|nr:hypothetical protein [Flavobacteriaceae bacterium Ap0902]
MSIQVHKIINTFIYNAFQERYLIFNHITKTGIIFWILGFIITEIIITLQGFGVNNYSFFVALLSFSVLMLVGIGMLLFNRLRTAKNSH